MECAEGRVGKVTRRQCRRVEPKVRGTRRSDQRRESSRENGPQTSQARRAKGGLDLASTVILARPVLGPSWGYWGRLGSF